MTMNRWQPVPAKLNATIHVLKCEQNPTNQNQWTLQAVYEWAEELSTLAGRDHLANVQRVFVDKNICPDYVNPNSFLFPNVDFKNIPKGQELFTLLKSIQSYNVSLEQTKPKNGSVNPATALPDDYYWRISAWDTSIPYIDPNAPPSVGILQTAGAVVNSVTPNPQYAVQDPLPQYPNVDNSQGLHQVPNLPNANTQQPYTPPAQPYTPPAQPYTPPQPPVDDTIETPIFTLGEGSTVEIPDWQKQKLASIFADQNQLGMSVGNAFNGVSTMLAPLVESMYSTMYESVKEAGIQSGHHQSPEEIVRRVGNMWDNDARPILRGIMADTMLDVIAQNFDFITNPEKYFISEE